jgi:formate hydrogenlyase transcriptional activator
MVIDLGSRSRLRRVVRARFSLLSEYSARIRVLEQARDQQALVHEINKLLLIHLEPERLFEAISSALWPQTHHDFMALTALEEGGTMERLRFLDTPPFRGRYQIGKNMPEFLGRRLPALSTGRIEVLGPDQIAAVDPPEAAQRLLKEGIRSMCYIPLVPRGNPLGVLSLGSREEHRFSGLIIELLEEVAMQVSVALDNALTFQGIRSLQDKLVEEKLYLEEEVGRDFATSEIIGKSSAILSVLQQIQTVAHSDATVLLLGETGTGKELLARAIHEHSRRKARTFVKLNCSAIPLGLMESELFGHERGAFTGAIAKKTGRFELAHQGTLFLDEVGDLPLELQPKLLRAIQEREFERLGSNATIRVDVRLIAATHRDLATMVGTGAFRSDLFYRLNVFPIQIPPLRDRKEDIPNLVRYFTQKFARAMDKRIERIPSESMEALIAWPWPGNIRELQNLVERSVILSQGGELRVPLAELRTAPELNHEVSSQTLENMERDGILAALKACGGVIGGPDGAAARLGLKRTTLHSKMKKLGIERGW